MPTVSNPNAAVTAGNGLGPTTYIYAITTGTISVEDAIASMTSTYGQTIAGVTGTAGATEYVAAQGGSSAAAVSGIALTATFDDL